MWLLNTAMRRIATAIAIAFLGCHTKNPLEAEMCAFGRTTGGLEVPYSGLFDAPERLHREIVQVEGWYGGVFEGLFFWETEDSYRSKDLEARHVALAELPQLRGRLEACRGRRLRVVGEFLDDRVLGMKVIIVHAAEEL